MNGHTVTAAAKQTTAGFAGAAGLQGQKTGRTAKPARCKSSTVNACNRPASYWCEKIGKKESGTTNKGTHAKTIREVAHQPAVRRISISKNIYL